MSQNNPPNGASAKEGWFDHQNPFDILGSSSPFQDKLIHLH